MPPDNASQILASILTKLHLLNNDRDVYNNPVLVRKLLGEISGDFQRLGGMADGMMRLGAMLRSEIPNLVQRQLADGGVGYKVLL